MVAPHIPHVTLPVLPEVIPRKVAPRIPHVTLPVLPEVIPRVVAPAVAGQQLQRHVKRDTDPIPVGIVVPRHHLPH